MMRSRDMLVVICAMAAPLLTYGNTVVISSGMNTAGSDFVTTQTPDNTVTFGFDWASSPTPTESGYSTVPPSPGGDTVGLRIESNNTNDTTNYQEGVTVWCTTEPQTANYDVEVHLFIAYPISGSGSTEHAGIVIQSNGNGIRCLRNNAMSGCNPAFGVWGTNPSFADLSTTASAYPQDGLSLHPRLDAALAALNLKDTR